MRFFEGFKGQLVGDNMVWQEVSTGFPFRCSQCGRDFPVNTHRWIGNSMTKHSHYGSCVLCNTCKTGRDPNRAPVPVYAKRRTSLD